MLRLSEVKLPLEHGPEAIRAAVLARLRLQDAELLGLTVFKRSYDARRRGAIELIYALDIEVADEAALLQRFENDRHLGPSPDTSYRFVATGPATPNSTLTVVSEITANVPSFSDELRMVSSCHPVSFASGFGVMRKSA